MTDARTYRGADVGSDHHLIAADMKLKLNRTSKTKSSSKKYDTTKLKLPEYQQAFKLELQNKFASLQELDSEDIETHWTAVKESYQKTAEATIGFH